MSLKSTLPILLCLALLSGVLSACVSGGVIELGVEPATPTTETASQATPTSEGATPVTPTPTEAPLPAGRKQYTNSAFGLAFIYPSDWFGPDEYTVENTLRVAIGSDVVYPYGTDRTEQIYTVQNAYYITLQYSTNNQNQYWQDTLSALRGLQDGESISTARSLVIRVRAVRIGDYEGVEYISTLSETAQTEPVYGREVILVDPQSNVLTISGSPNNVDVSSGDWRAAYQAVDEANQALFHEIVDSITFQAPRTPAETGETGLLRGSLCFPSESIPPLDLYFKNLSSGAVSEMATVENQASFEITLPAGSYVAYAYMISDPKMGGAYTNAAACGLTPECRDHTLVAVDVQPNQVVEGVQICDFYAPEFIPTNPKAVESSDPSVAGLIYRWVLGQFRVDTDGQARMLAAMQSMPSFSPDGAQALFAKDGDIWLLTFADHSVRNLTNTPDRYEVEPQWWPVNPEVIVFGSASVEQGYDIMSGHLTIMRLDGAAYKVLSPEFISTSTPALSPDGQTIAYDNGSELWLYNLNAGAATVVDLYSYGLKDVQQVSSPAWSPDGSKLALWVTGPFSENGTSSGLAIIDFDHSNAVRLHTYQSEQTGSWIPTPAWSPDGQWLAAFARGEGGTGLLWLLKADGTLEVNLGSSTDPVWSPDGRLLYVTWNTGALVDTKVSALRPGEQPQQLALTPGSVPVFWIGK